MIQRWSLAGQQAKFSLARIGDRWFWATYEHPSTHIFKPAAAGFADADLAEKACLDLALEAGIPASRSEVVEFRGQRAFAVERWDRADAIRLHAEDLTQALGQPPYEKYSVSAQDVMKLLEPHGQVWPFVRQLAFNTAVGNSDAHGKNYSVLLFTEGVVRLAPCMTRCPSSFGRRWISATLWTSADHSFAKRPRRPVGSPSRNEPRSIPAGFWTRSARCSAMLVSDCPTCFARLASPPPRPMPPPNTSVGFRAWLGVRPLVSDP